MKKMIETSKESADLEVTRRKLLESGAVRLDADDGIISEQEKRAFKELLNRNHLEIARER